jgi:membrane protein
MKLPVAIFRHLVRAYFQWLADDGSLMAGAVAFYAALSFFPLLLVLIGGLGALMRTTELGQDARQHVLDFIEDYASLTARENTAQILDQVGEQWNVGGTLGGVFLLFAAAAMFVQFEHAFDRIWNTQDRQSRGFVGAVRNLVVYRLRAFVMLLALGGLVLVGFIANLTLTTLRDMTGDFGRSDLPWWVMQFGLGMALNVLALTALYKVLPKVTVHWREAARGALLTAVLWEFGRLILTRALVYSRYSAYGLVGSFIALMLWMYFAAAVLFFGAEYIQVICASCNGRGRRRKVHPPDPERTAPAAAESSSDAS